MSASSTRPPAVISNEWSVERLQFDASMRNFASSLNIHDRTDSQ
jgi:hypothetical protein